MLTLSPFFLSTVSAWQRWTLPSDDTFTFGCPHGQTETQSGCNKDTGTEVPLERHGHSMNTWVFKTPTLATKTRAILFGGRSNDIVAFHDPQKYAVGEQDGVFNVLDGGYPFRGKRAKHVLDNCNRTTPIEDRSQECIPIGDVRRARYFNDIWAYDLDCPRDDDQKCTDDNEGWYLLNRGADYGACKAREGRLRVAQVIECAFPQERYQHTAAIYGDDLFVFGGYAMFCEDYCEDMWRASLTKCRTVMYPGCAEWSEADGYDPVKPHPYKRWRSASTLIRARSDLPGFWFVFGGYRLWHGFRTDNYIDNLWSNYDVDCTPEEWSECRFQGGYMDDLWQMDMSTSGWFRVQPKYRRISDPGRAWEDRHRTKDVVFWPKGRAGHTVASTRCVEKDDNQIPKDAFFPLLCRMWMFGGFRVVFPFPESTSFGYLKGTIGLPTGGGDTPYPSLPYYLNDMWQYNPNTGYWKEAEVTSPSAPPARYLHTMVASGNTLLMFAGYRSNEYFNDFWHFNVDTLYWNLKEDHVHALLPDTCTADQAVPDDQPTPKQYALPVQYAGKTSVSGIPTLLKAHAFDTTDRLDGKFGRPSEHRLIPTRRKASPGWDGCRDRSDGFPISKFYVEHIGDGKTPRINPDTGAPFYLPYDDPAAIPLRDAATGGYLGKPIEEIFLNKLLYLEPVQRAQHATTYAEVVIPGNKVPERIFLMAGGIGPANYELKSLSFTNAFRTDFEVFAFKVDKCINDCSGRGDCLFGFCICYNGFYGADCGNITCPGDFCYYDADTHQQVCSHCCSAGETLRADGELYNPLARKVPCDKDHAGENHGICDGYGSCQCAQPYIGDDCALKDCLNDCSGHGWCSMEYPQSRCMCTRPYVGLACEFKTCLNNCSYRESLLSFLLLLLLFVRLNRYVLLNNVCIFIGSPKTRSFVNVSRSLPIIFFFSFSSLVSRCPCISVSICLY